MSSLKSKKNRVNPLARLNTNPEVVLELAGDSAVLHDHDESNLPSETLDVVEHLDPEPVVLAPPVVPPPKKEEFSPKTYKVGDSYAKGGISGEVIFVSKNMIKIVVKGEGVKLIYI